jgi:hypothetical protein
MNNDGLIGRYFKMWRHVGLKKRVKYSEKLAASIFRVENFKKLVNFVASIAITAHTTSSRFYIISAVGMHLFCSLSYDRSIAFSEASSPQSRI